jgi:hypothetical protein
MADFTGDNTNYLDVIHKILHDNSTNKPKQPELLSEPESYNLPVEKYTKDASGTPVLTSVDDEPLPKYSTPSEDKLPGWAPNDAFMESLPYIYGDDLTVELGPTEDAPSADEDWSSVEKASDEDLARLDAKIKEAGEDPDLNTGPNKRDNALASEEETKNAIKVQQEAKKELPPMADELPEQPIAPKPKKPRAPRKPKPDLEMFGRLAETLDKLAASEPPPPPGPPADEEQPDEEQPDEEQLESKKGTPRWLITSLFGRMGEHGGRTLGTMGRGLGAIIGAGAKAVGNMGAAMNTAGAQQAAKFGNAPGGAAAAFAQGLGDTGAVGAQALGDMVGGAAESFFGELGGSGRDYAAHLELETIQDEMLQELQRQIIWANQHNVPLDRAGIWETWKNIYNSAGNVMSSLNRNRTSPMLGGTQAAKRNGGRR